LRISANTTGNMCARFSGSWQGDKTCKRCQSSRIIYGHCINVTLTGSVPKYLHTQETGLALVHRPVYEDIESAPADPRPSIWLSYCPLEDARRDVRALTELREHHVLIDPELCWEQLRIGGGAPPLRTPLGWLLLYHGFAAETAAATVIEVATQLGVPISTTHAINGAILGVGTVKHRRAVRWGGARTIVLAWILILPACSLLGWLLMKLATAVFGL
jgi:Phosphate transporter family